MSRLPSLFLSHGSPMHAVQTGAASAAWTRLGSTLPRPRAILIASAHWESSVPMLTGNTQLETIHDFGGFPQELYQLRYPAHGSPELAARAVQLLKSADIAAGVDGCRGLDHGAWVPLRWMYPAADIPVVQLSIQPELGAAHHLRLGRALALLADEGVLIIGSGHTTHNLRDWMTRRGGRVGEPLPYVQDFARWLHDEIEAGDADELVHWRERAPGAPRAHPTEEHFLPFFIAYGASGSQPQAEQVLDGIDGGALAMDSYLFKPRSLAGAAAFSAVR